MHLLSCKNLCILMHLSEWISNTCLVQLLNFVILHLKLWFWNYCPHSNAEKQLLWRWDISSVHPELQITLTLSSNRHTFRIVPHRKTSPTRLTPRKPTWNLNNLKKENNHHLNDRLFRFLGYQNLKCPRCKLTNPSPNHKKEEPPPFFPTAAELQIPHAYQWGVSRCQAW